MKQVPIVIFDSEKISRNISVVPEMITSIKSNTESNVSNTGIVVTHNSIEKAAKLIDRSWTSLETFLTTKIDSEAIETAAKANTNLFLADLKKEIFKQAIDVGLKQIHKFL